jgi:hypothetical protein
VREAGDAAVVLGNRNAMILGPEKAGKPGRQLRDAHLVPEPTQELARGRHVGLAERADEHVRGKSFRQY